MIHVKYQYSLVRTSRTATLPVTLASLKNNLRIDDAAFDQEVSDLLEECVDFLEQRCGVALSLAEFELTIDRPTLAGCDIYLPIYPLVSVQNIIARKYSASGPTDVTVSATS